MANGFRNRAERIALGAMATAGVAVLLADLLGWLDEMAALATADLLATGHADRLATRVARFLGDGGEGAADSFREVERRSLQIKVDFYDQFLPALEHVGI
ncbi:hypothetical protein [Streptomyces sp. NPDC054797]